MKQLALEIVRLDAVVVGDAQCADARRGEIESSGTTESAGADDEDARGSEFRLPLDADFAE